HPQRLLHGAAPVRTLPRLPPERAVPGQRGYFRQPADRALGVESPLDGHHSRRHLPQRPGGRHRHLHPRSAGCRWTTARWQWRQGHPHLLQDLRVPGALTMHSRPTCRLSPLLRAMPRLRVLAVLLAALPLAATARIEAPDHVIYGNATVFGNPVAAGTLVEVRSAVSDALLARYPLGRNPRLGGQFALNIPMDTVEPRIPGRARAGDPVRIFVGNQLAAETSVGEEGVAVRLDVDPQFMGTGPALQISDVDMPEGNDGMSVARFDLSMNTTSNQTVSV